MFAQINTVLGRLADSYEAHSALMLERFRKVDVMHMRTRLLIGSKLTTGDEQEQLFAGLDRLTTNVQAHIDALELTDAQKAHASKNEIARMQQLLVEAGSYQSEQMEMDGLEPGGHER